MLCSILARDDGINGETKGYIGYMEIWRVSQGGISKGMKDIWEQRREYRGLGKETETTLNPALLTLNPDPSTGSRGCRISVSNQVSLSRWCLKVRLWQ